MTSTRKRIRIDQLIFTGPERPPATLAFGDGVNIIWGASNTGKSFVRKSIDYVLGGDKPTLPPEGAGYDNFLLWLTLPEARKVTLRCSALGGDVYKADGHVLDVVPKSSGYEVLSRKHTKGPNVSKFLLTEAGFREARLLRNERAEKSTFSLRMLMRYLLVDETRMIDERSVLLAHNTTVTAEDKSLIKFLLTGVDGSSVEQVRSADQLKAARDGKIEILSQLADELRGSIDDTVGADQISAQFEEAEREREDLLSVLSERQSELDQLTMSIRTIDEDVRAEASQIAELNAMVSRFLELGAIYASDVGRLEGLEEGSFLVQRLARANCPLCGADPEHQTHDHGMSDVEKYRKAIEAEITKVMKETVDLNAAISDAQDQVVAGESRLVQLASNRADKVQALQEAQRKETSARTIFAEANRKFDRAGHALEIRRRLSSFEREIERLLNQSVSARQRADGLDVSIDLTQSEAHELSKVVKRVLKAWNYPGADAVHYEKSDHDIVVDGKRRRDNGAGVRAILHSAFKVGLLVYCIEKGRPHPGFLVLDSPLLAYRPVEEGRYGTLQSDEIALKNAGVARHFYAHLHSLKDRAQFIIIENHRSDQEVVVPFPNVEFTKDPSSGRLGLFV